MRKFFINSLVNASSLYFIFTLVTLLSVDRNCFGQNWQPLGPDDFKQLSYNQANQPSIAQKSSGNYVAAFADRPDNFKLTVKERVGNEWVTINPNLVIHGVSYISLKIDLNDNIYIAFSNQPNSGRISVLKYNGTNWSYVGNPAFSNGSADHLSLTLNQNQEPIVAYSDASLGNKLCVKQFSNNAWSNLGNPGFSPGNAFWISVCVDLKNNPLVAFRDGANGFKGTVMKYEGSGWSPLGGFGFTPAQADYLSLAVNQANIPFVAFKDNSTSRGRVAHFQNNSWQFAGNPFSPGEAIQIDLKMDQTGMPIVLFTDWSHPRKSNSVRKLSGNNWVDIGTGFQTGQSNYNSLIINQQNNPVVIYSDQYLLQKAMVQQFNGSSWEKLTEDGFSDEDGNFPASTITSTGQPIAVFADGVRGNKASVMKFDGNNWQYVGSPGFSNGATARLCIAVDMFDQPVIAFIDYSLGERLIVMKFDGSNWVTVGSQALSVGAVTFTSIQIDNTNQPVVAYNELSQNNKAFVKKFDGTSWITMGSSPIAVSGAYFLTLALDNAGLPVVAFADESQNFKIAVRKFDGLQWQPVGGSSLPATTFNFISMDLLNNSPIVAFSDAASSNKASVMAFNGTSWNYVGNPGFTQTAAENVNLTIDNLGQPVLAYREIVFLNVRACVVKFSNGSWASLGSSKASAGTVFTPTISSKNSTYYLVYSSGGMFARKFNDEAKGLNFDGINDYINIGNPPLLNFGFNDFTLEATIKTSFLGGTAHDFIISKTSSGQDLQYALTYRAHIDGKPVFSITGLAVVGSTSIADGQTHHLAVTRKGLQINLYVDGVLSGSGIMPAPVSSTSTNPVILGGRLSPLSNPYFNGNIDEVRFWNRALCLSEIQNSMNCELQTAVSGLVGHYKFNHGYVGADNTGVNTAADASGNNYTGTLVNFALDGLTSNWTYGLVSSLCNIYTPSTATISPTGPINICPSTVAVLQASAGTSHQWLKNGIPIASAIQQNYNASESGNYSVILTSPNGCIEQSNSVQVTVSDNQPPQIVQPSNIYTSTSSDGTNDCTASINVPAVIFTDNCAATLTWAMTGASSGNGTGQIGLFSFNKGVTTITYTATDNAALSDTKHIQVQVLDDQPPGIICPSDVILNPATLQGTVFTFTILPVNNCSQATVTQVNGLPSGSMFPIGVTSNTFQVSGENGMTAQCSFTVTVRDPFCSNNPNAPKVYICKNGNTLCVNVNALTQMLNQGAVLGRCEWYTNGQRITQVENTIDLSKNITIYPNPIVEGQLKIKMDNVETGIYDFQIINSNGQLIKSEQLIHRNDQVIQQINLPNISKGMYSVIIKNGNTLYRSIFVVL